MRRFAIVVTLLLVVGAAGAAVAYWAMERDELAWQLDCHRIGAAPSYEEAAQLLAELDRAPNHQEKLSLLTTKWGTGNQAFDERLVRWMLSTDGSGALLQAFSEELSWREELLPRWVEYWREETELPMEEELASIEGYLSAIHEGGAASRREVSWRDVLDMQAWFVMRDSARLAVRLGPENAGDRYGQWLETEGEVRPVDAADEGATGIDAARENATEGAAPLPRAE